MNDAEKSKPRRDTMRATSFRLAICIVMTFVGCSESRGVIPPGGTNETPLNTKQHNKEMVGDEIDPDAERVSMPQIDLADFEKFPIKSDAIIPTRKAKTPLILTGVVTHPSPESKGAGVTIKFWSRKPIAGVPTPPGRGHVVESFKGSAGPLPGGPADEYHYELHGRLPERGHYDVTMEVFHAILEPDISKPSSFDNVTTTLVAEGAVDVE